MAIVVDYEAFSQGVRTKFTSVKALALHHNVNPKYPARAERTMWLAIVGSPILLAHAVLAASAQVRIEGLSS